MSCLALAPRLNTASISGQRHHLFLVRQDDLLNLWLTQFVSRADPHQAQIVRNQGCPHRDVDMTQARRSAALHRRALPAGRLCSGRRRGWTGLIIALDTNMLVRALVADHPEQLVVVRKLIAGNTIFLPRSVLPETEWVQL